MAKGFALSIVMKAVDKATAPIRAVAQAANQAVKPIERLQKFASSPFKSIYAGVEKINKPFKRLQTMHNAFRISLDKMGVGKITSSFKSMTGAIGNAIGSAVKFAGSLVGMGGAISGVASAIYKITRAASDYGDTAWKTSQKIGMNVEAWQEMAHAGEMSGVENEALSKGLVKLNKNIVEAAMGNKTLSAWFKRVGVSCVDASGKARNVEDVFMDLSEVFGKQKDGAKKTAAAMALMGKSGADMIPMLNSGKKGMQEMRQEARDLGIVMDEKTAKSAEAFNDNVNRLMKVVKGLAFNLGSELIPIINDLVLSMKAWIEKNRGLIKTKITEWVEKLKKYLPELKEMFFKTIDSIKDFIIKVNTLVEALGGFKGILTIIGTYLTVSFLGALASASSAIIAFGVTLMANPAGPILIGIALAIMGVYYAIKNWDKIWPVIKQLGHILMTPLRLFGQLMDYLTSFDLVDIGIGIISSLWEGMKSIWAQIKTGFNAWIEYIKSFFSGIDLFDIGLGILSSLWAGMKSIWPGIKSWFDGVRAKLKINIPQPALPAPGVLPTPVPFLPKKPEPFKPLGGPKSAAALKGAQGQSAKATVDVKFINTPPNVNVNAKSDKNTDLGMMVKRGPAMATQ